MELILIIVVLVLLLAAAADTGVAVEVIGDRTRSYGQGYVYERDHILNGPVISLARALLRCEANRFLSAFQARWEARRRASRTQFIAYRVTNLRLSCFCAQVNSTPAY